MATTTTVNSTVNFNKNTRRTRTKVTTMTYADETYGTYNLSNVGFLANIYIRFAGKLTATSSTKTSFTPAAFAPFNLLKNVDFKLNNGINVVAINGERLYEYNVAMKYASTVDQELDDNVYRFSNVCSSAGTENDVDFTLKIPISINDRDTIGMLLLQTQQMVATIGLGTRSASDLTSDTDIDMSLTGTWYITSDIFEVPSDMSNYPNLAYIHQILMDTKTISSTGEQRLSLPLGNTYLRIINSVAINGVQSLEDVQNYALKYNLSTTTIDLAMKDMLGINRDELGRSMPLGAFCVDFTNQGVPGMGSDRDWVDSSAISELDQFITIDSNATLGSNNNIVSIVRDMLIPISM